MNRSVYSNYGQGSNPLLKEVSVMQIYVLRDDQQTGPFTVGEICTQLGAGTITHKTFVWWEGLPEWQTLEQTKLVPVPTPTPIYDESREFRGHKETCSLAIWSLVLGILGFLCNPFAPIGAIVTGHMARSKIHRRSDLKGNLLALVGLTFGYLWLLAFVMILLSHDKLEKMKQDVRDTYRQIQDNKAK
jgi:hypothetical protein